MNGSMKSLQKKTNEEEINNKKIQERERRENKDKILNRKREAELTKI